MSIASMTIRPQTRILGLVGAGHMMSHFYSNTLPPLLPLLNSDLGISYTMLGALLSLRGVMSSGMQLPAGILVDRYGAKTILTIGLAMCVIGTLITAAAMNYWMILFAGVILGIGNSAFHPADYSILSASMDEKFMGRAFSLHSFSGNLGNAIAPAVLITITAFYNWRISLMVAGIAGIVVMAGLLTQWKYISEDSVPRGKRFKTEKTDASTDSSTEEEPQQSTMEVMRYVFTSPAILFLFLYYCMN
ncbi:MAG: MFS transporter, partial [Alphaproteobacteria bacterium]